MNWLHKKILVVGLGSTGLSLIKFFTQQGVMVSGFDLKLSDSQRSELAQLFPHTSFYSEDLSAAIHHGHFDTLALSPGVSSKLPEVQLFQKRGGLVVGDIAILSSLIKGKRDKIIAITGSNGKSTVTELVGFLCRQCGLDTVIAGNIGLPVLEAYHQRAGKSADVWVLELSSFQLDTTENLAADAAVCLNISEDHLDRYDDLLDYAHSKDKIFQNAQVQILNADDVFCQAMTRTAKDVKYFSIKNPSDYWVCHQNSEYLLMAGNEILLSSQKLALQGLHNIANVLAAIALCEAIGLDRKKLVSHIPFFKGLAHRVEKIGELDGVSFIDDSKGTNVGATCAALLGAPVPVVLIAGGLGKGQDFSPLVKVVQEKVRAVYLIGTDAQNIAEVLQATQVKISFCHTLEEATKQAYLVAQPGDWILLSPACASMDMFKNYEHRSQIFINSFRLLANETS